MAIQDRRILLAPRCKAGLARQLMGYPLSTPPLPALPSRDHTRFGKGKDIFPQIRAIPRPISPGRFQTNIQWSTLPVPVRRPWKGKPKRILATLGRRPKCVRIITQPPTTPRIGQGIAHNRTYAARSVALVSQNDGFPTDDCHRPNNRSGPLVGAKRQQPSFCNVVHGPRQHGYRYQ